MELLKTWLSEEHGRAVRLARHLGVPPSFVSRMAGGTKPIPTDHGALIEEFTCGAVTRRAMFPETCERIWPDMRAAPKDPQPTDTSPTTEPQGVS